MAATLRPESAKWPDMAERETKAGRSRQLSMQRVLRRSTGRCARCCSALHDEAAAGGRPTLPVELALKPGMRDARVALLRQRLIRAGDLKNSSCGSTSRAAQGTPAPQCKSICASSATTPRRWSICHCAVFFKSACSSGSLQSALTGCWRGPRARLHRSPASARRRGSRASRCRRRPPAARDRVPSL